MQNVRRHRTPRSRASRACVSCKEKKLKCDELSPACSHCSRLDQVCLVEDPDTKKHRPRDYLRILEERLAILERGENQDASSSHGPQTPAQTAHSTNVSEPSMSTDKEAENADLPTNIGLLDVQSSQAEPQYLGSSSGFAFSHLINASLRGVPMQQPPHGTRSSVLVANAPVPCLLPEYDVAISLSNAYFENIHPQYPFLHEPTFRQYEESVIRPSPELSEIRDDSTPRFFVNMVYAVGALVTGCEPLSEQLYTSAQLYLGVLSSDNLEAIQAILCYAMYSLRSLKGPSLWKLSGLALRQCIELGYHRTKKRNGSRWNPLQDEMRKRTFWCVQGLDCTCALRLGRPLGIQIHEIDVELPLDVDETRVTATGIQGTPRASHLDPPTSMSNAIHVFRLRCIWARIHTSVYSAKAPGAIDPDARRDSVARLRTELEDWLRTAPEVVPRVGTALSIFSTKVWYDLNYSGTILQLYRLQLAESDTAPDDVFIDCMHAANNVCRLYRRQYVGTSVKQTWGTLHCLFLAGLTYLHCLWSSQAARNSVDHSEVNKTCTDCTMVLVVIAERWDVAAPYRDIFEVLASRTLSMIVNRQMQIAPFPTTAAVSDTSERDAMSRWMADIDGMGMLAGFDDLLVGFMEDYPPYTSQDITF